MFLLAILIIFLPRYVVVSISGYKIRHVLITFFVFYPILGNVVYNFGIRMKTALLPYTQIKRVHFCIPCITFLIITLIQCLPLPLAILKYCSPVRHHFIVSSGALLGVKDSWHSISYNPYESLAWWMFIGSLVFPVVDFYK